MLEFATDDPAAALASHALYHAAPASPAEPTLRYRITRAGGGTYLGHAPARPPFGPSPLGEVLSFIEWRATEDTIAPVSGGVVFLHAAAVSIRGNLVLLVGDSGAGKSTITAHLLARGHLVLGDDLVRFAPDAKLLSAVPRSFKLDDKSLEQLPLVSHLLATVAVG